MRQALLLFGSFQAIDALFEISPGESELQLAQVGLSEEIISLRPQLGAGGRPPGFMRAADGARGASLAKVGLARGEVLAYLVDGRAAAPGKAFKR